MTVVCLRAALVLYGVSLCGAVTLLLLAWWP